MWRGEPLAAFGLKSRELTSMRSLSTASLTATPRPNRQLRWTARRDAREQKFPLPLDMLGAAYNQLLSSWLCRYRPAPNRRTAIEIRNRRCRQVRRYLDIGRR